MYGCFLCQLVLVCEKGGVGLLSVNDISFEDWDPVAVVMNLEQLRLLRSMMATTGDLNACLNVLDGMIADAVDRERSVRSIRLLKREVWRRLQNATDEEERSHWYLQYQKLKAMTPPSIQHNGGCRSSSD